MRFRSIVLAAVAVAALGSSAYAQSSTALHEDTGSTDNTHRAPAARADQPANPTPGPAATEGTIVAPGAATTGSSQAPGGTSNPRSGTQAPDAQKGGGGSMGAR